MFRLDELSGLAMTDGYLHRLDRSMTQAVRKRWPQSTVVFSRVAETLLYCRVKYPPFIAPSRSSRHRV